MKISIAALGILVSCSAPNHVPLDAPSADPDAQIDATRIPGCDIGTWNITWTCLEGCEVESAFETTDYVIIAETTIQLKRTSCESCEPIAANRDDCDAPIVWELGEYEFTPHRDYTVEFRGYPGPRTLKRVRLFELVNEQ